MLNAIEALISKSLIDSYIPYDELFQWTMLREYNETKEDIKISETSF